MSEWRETERIEQPADERHRLRDDLLDARAAEHFDLETLLLSRRHLAGSDEVVPSLVRSLESQAGHYQDRSTVSSWNTVFSRCMNKR